MEHIWVVTIQIYNGPNRVGVTPPPPPQPLSMGKDSVSETLDFLVI
jgi:hypothetical protein